MSKISISKFRTDAAKEVDGVWIDAGEGLQLLVARMNNPKYEAAILEASGPFSRRVGKSGAEEIQSRIRKAVAKHVLLGWKNLTDDDGKDVVYSPEKALEYFTEAPDFYRLVLEYATDVENFRTQARDAALGN